MGDFGTLLFLNISRFLQATLPLGFHPILEGHSLQTSQHDSYWYVVIPGGSSKPKWYTEPKESKGLKISDENHLLGEILPEQFNSLGEINSDSNLISGVFEGLSSLSW